MRTPQLLIVRLLALWRHHENLRVLVDPALLDLPDPRLANASVRAGEPLTAPGGLNTSRTTGRGGVGAGGTVGAALTTEM